MLESTGDAIKCKFDVRPLYTRISGIRVRRLFRRRSSYQQRKKKDCFFFRRRDDLRDAISGSHFIASINRDDWRWRTEPLFEFWTKASTVIVCSVFGGTLENCSFEAAAVQTWRAIQAIIYCDNVRKLNHPMRNAVGKDCKFKTAVNFFFRFYLRGLSFQSSEPSYNLYVRIKLTEREDIGYWLTGIQI